MVHCSKVHYRINKSPPFDPLCWDASSL